MYKPSFLKWVPSWMIITIALFLVAVTVVYAAFRLFTFTGDVQVLEGITTSDSLTFSVQLYPGEEQVITRTLHNAGSADVEIKLKRKVTPHGKGVSVELSEDDFIIAGNGSFQFQIIISVDNDATPGSFTVEVDVERK